MLSQGQGDPPENVAGHSAAALAREVWSGPCPKRCPGMESFTVLSLALTSTEFPKVLNFNQE